MQYFTCLKGLKRDRFPPPKKNSNVCSLSQAWLLLTGAGGVPKTRDPTFPMMQLESTFQFQHFSPWLLNPHLQFEEHVLYIFF